MSLTIEQVINNASHLAKRLNDGEAVADILLNETNRINEKIEAIKQFQGEVENLNEIANQKPHSQLIANIQKDTRHLKEIQQENRELRAALEEYQTTIEHIMFKYRQHTNEQIYKSKINFNSIQNNNVKYHNIIKSQAEKIREMASVMQKAALIDDENEHISEDLLRKLKIENEGLREMLEISKKIGAGKLLTEDKDVQTES